MQDDPRRDVPPEAEAHQPVETPEPPSAATARPEAWPSAEPRSGEPRAGEPPPEAESLGPPAEPRAAPTEAHSVPAAEPGESTRCPRCGTENRPGISFCRSCGQRLMAPGVAAVVERPGAPEGTQACPRCGTHNRVGTAFCQNCGANLRTAAAGYVPPAVGPAPSAEEAAEERRGAVLGPIVLLIAAAGLVIGWLLPFPFGTDSLYERAFAGGGYGVAFWTAYDRVAGTLPEQAYFGFAAPVLLLAGLLVILAIAGFVRAAPGALQIAGLIAAFLWAIGLAVLFVLVEAGSGFGGDLLGMLRNLTAGGIILFLASLIAIIGILTRFARG
jgi:Double zinc ribbon